MTSVVIKQEELDLLTDEQLGEVLDAFAEGMEEGSAPIEATVEEHVAMISMVRCLRDAAQRLKKKSVTAAIPS